MNFFKFTKSILSITCFIAGFSQLSAQSLITSQVVIPRDVELSQTQEEQLIETTENVFFQYAEKATLINPLTNKVDQTSLNAFKRLFNDGAKVVNDLSRYGVVSNFTDYGSDIRSYLKETGAIYDPITGGLLKEIDYDKDGFYKIDVLFRKVMHNGLETNNEDFRCKSGRVFTLTMTVIIDEDNLSKGLISKINGPKGTDCSDPFISVGLNIEAGTDFGLTNGFAETKDLMLISGLTNPEQDFDNSLDSIGGTMINSVSYLGGGANVLLPLTKKEAIYLNVGVNYNLYNTTTTFNGTYTFEDELSNAGILLDGSDAGVYYKEVTLSNLVDKSTFHALQFPIGIRLTKKPKQGQDHSFMLDIMALPTLVLSGNTTLTVDNIEYAGYFDGTTNFDRADKIENVDFLGFGSPDFLNSNTPNNNVGEAKRAIISSSVFSLAARLSPGFRYQFTDNIIAEGSLNINYGISSFVVNAEEEGASFSQRPLQDDGNNFDYTDELGGSLLENYYESVPFSTIGLRLGVIYIFR